MSLGHEVSPDQAMYLLQQDVMDLKEDVENLQTAVTGGLEPSKGLLWIVADLVKMVASLTQLVDAQRQALTSVERSINTHTQQPGHERRESPWWNRLAYDCTKQVASLVIAAILLLLLLGTQTWVRAAIAK